MLHSTVLCTVRTYEYGVLAFVHIILSFIRLVTLANLNFKNAIAEIDFARKIGVFVYFLKSGKKSTVTGLQVILLSRTHWLE